MLMDPTALILIAAGLSLIMALAWVIQRVTGHSGWVDVIWSLAVGLGGIAAAILPGEGAVDARRITVGCLVAVWSLRLASHIAARNKAGEDDPRYEKMAKEWGRNAAVMMFLFLQIQAVAAFVLVLAVRLAATNPEPFLRLLDMAGIALLLIAMGGEAVADAQLARFSKANKGRKAVCDVGLWKYSRHPNYFFEWLGWVAWAVIAISLSGASSWGWLSLGAPILMYVLLVYASGIPPLEAHMLATRGDVFRAYQARTNAFFPGPQHAPKEL